MLTGKMVRVRHARNKLVPMYLPAGDRQWLGLAEQLLFAFRDAEGHTRGELEEQLGDLVGDGPAQLVHQGLAKLLEDRCEFEVAADVPPEQVREAVFRVSARHHLAGGQTQEPFDRDAALREAAEELNLTPEQVDLALFADLKGEQRVLKFEPLTPEQLILRYNTALAQSILLRCTAMEIRVWNESASRFRQLFRAVKFHRLICTIRPAEGSSYKLVLDGPLSLFSSTQKYGVQLAMFLPTLLHCKTFELRAEVRWGAEKKEKTFTLTGADGLRSHLADFGVYTPPEVKAFAVNFRNNVVQWTLSDDPAPQLIDSTIWVPDFTMTHATTGEEIFVEVLGFWRKLDIEAHYKRLKKAFPGRFILVVSEAYRTDDDGEFAAGSEVYRFKKTPIADEVAKLGTRLIGK
jgi:predicted nuclease of restriction endonuclease-like RecB superfamily